MIHAIRDGIKGIFSDTDWKSGQPQRYGWQEEGKEGKTMPLEIVQFIERRKKVEVKKLESEVNIKSKKDDHPKQKGRPAGKRKPPRVGKA